VLLARNRHVVAAHLGNHGAEGLVVDRGARREAWQLAALEPGRELAARQGREQHAPGGGGVRRQPGAQVQAVGHEALTADRHVARHDHNLVAIEHRGRERFARQRREPVQGGLQQAGQAGRGQVAARETQHLGGEPVVTAVALQVAQVRECEQVPARRRARETGALGGLRRVEALALGVEALQHRHALGHAFDEVGLGDGRVRGIHGRDYASGVPVMRGDRTTGPMIAQSPAARVVRIGWGF
jgi:hypothetical protein